MPTTPTTPALTPPIAARRPSERKFSGVTIAEDYAWLENPRDPEVIAYLEAENAYLNHVLAATGDLRERLHQELMARVQRTDTRVPVQIAPSDDPARVELLSGVARGDTLVGPPAGSRP